MSAEKILNLIGLIINTLGAFLMYKNSPQVQSQTFLYQRAELAEKIKKDKRKNKMVRFGMFLLFIGFVIQFLTLIFF